MKTRKPIPTLYALLALGVVLGAIPSLARRWREEAQDRRVAVGVEWNEYRDFNSRLALPDLDLMRELHTHGATALVVSPVTLSDLVQQHRVHLQDASLGADPLDVRRIQVTDAALAHQLFNQWSWRGLADLHLQSVGKTNFLSRKQGTFAALKDADAGYDPQTLQNARAAELAPILRINYDPWLSDAQWLNWLQDLPLSQEPVGVLFNSDDLPGGLVNLSFWKSRLKEAGVTQFLSEFHPAAAAWQMANALPANTYRAHSIPASELKDLKFGEQMSRWHRAVEERSCRLLLVRMGPTDSRDSYLTMLSSLSDLLTRHGWKASFPTPRDTWRDVTSAQRYLFPILAFCVAVFVPVAALRWAQSHPEHWRRSFFKITLGSVVGACVVAAVAQNPLTRIEIVPFRGIKLVFLLAWGLSLLLLYDPQELKTKLSQHVRRWDLIVGGLAAGAIGYMVLRSGNASAAWKPSWEQSVRNMLETALIARPRFKEFAIGHPALWVGLYLQYLHEKRRLSWDARGVIWLGMLGPISIVDTFCHLHTPLMLELLRTFNGLVLGVCVGSVAIRLLNPILLSPKGRSYTTRRKDDTLVYQRG